MHWAEVWSGESAVSRALRLALLPASWLYASGWLGYLSVYRLGLKHPARPHRPVVCVGNLRVGGSGKTPLTLHVADVLERLGHPVVLSLSGYGSPASEAAAAAPEGPLGAEVWGDEPALVRSERPHLPIVVGRRRVLASQIVHERWPDRVMLMDDGFQHLPLHKDVTLLLDPANPPNPWCLPAGPYREPRSGRGRATLTLDPWGAASAEGFRVVRRPLTFEPKGGARALQSGEEVHAICAIGDPARFFRDVEASGLVVVERTALPDHASIPPRYLEGSVASGRPLVVTAKDWVKLGPLVEAHGGLVHVARQETVVEPAHEFERWIAQQVEKVLAQSA